MRLAALSLGIKRVQEAKRIRGLFPLADASAGNCRIGQNNKGIQHMKMALCLRTNDTLCTYSSSGFQKRNTCRPRSGKKSWVAA